MWSTCVWHNIKGRNRQEGIYFTYEYIAGGCVQKCINHSSHFPAYIRGEGWQVYAVI